MVRSSFTKKEHLKKNKSIREVFDKGICLKGRLFKIFLLKRETGSSVNRVAFVIRKDLYNKKSVLRNRFKRLLREAYRKTKHLLLDGYDIVILATGIRKNTKSAVLEKDMVNVFKTRLKK